jgi:hypothetical protein
LDYREIPRKIDTATQTIHSANATPIPAPVDFPESLLNPIPITAVSQMEKILIAERSL